MGGRKVLPSSTSSAPHPYSICSPIPLHLRVLLVHRHAPYPLPHATLVPSPLPPVLTSSATQHRFICECFFMGGRALQLGFKKALDAYEGWSRQVGGRGEGRGEVGALRVALRATSFGGEGCSRDTCAHAWPRSRGSRV